MKTLYGPICGLLLTACAAAPTAPVPTPQASAPSPFITSSGMVIGTLSYRYVEAPEASWVVHLERIDAGAAEDYALPVSVDTLRHRGVFTGALPEGVYAFRDAAAAGHHFPAGASQLPFEVRSGEVRDAGHYAVNPVATE